jgi:hypothetical protein
LEGVITLVREEAVRLGDRLRDFESAGWASAFSGGAPGVGSSACREPGQATTLEAAERARQGLEACCDATERAMRGAGTAACSELTRVRAEIRRKQDTLRQYPSATASTASLPSLPPDCTGDSDWSTRDFGALWAAIDGLAYPETSRSFQSELDAAGSRLTVAQQGFKESLGDALGAIVRADRACAGHLQLGNSNDTLVTLETRINRALADENLAPSADLTGLEGQVEGARSTLQARADQGAERLFQNREIDPKIDQSAFADLPAARERFKSAPSQANLDSLCAAAAKAKGAVDGYWAENLPKLRERVSDARWLLRAAAAREATGPADGLPCIQEGLDALPARVTSGNSEAADNSVSIAQACLADYHTRWREWVSGIRQDLLKLAETAGSLPEDAQGPVASRVAAIRRDVADAGASLTAIATLLDTDSQIDEGALRREIGAANLNVPNERWTELGRLAGTETGEGLLAIRDEAVDGTLGDVVDVIAKHRPLADKLGSYVALSVAFEKYGTGDLDGAIESLRRVAPARASDRSAAIRHAALAYFLHTKSTMLGEDGSGGQVVALLLADAEQEIRAALRVQRGFELPALLQRGAAFKSFFEGFSSE